MFKIGIKRHGMRVGWCVLVLLALGAVDRAVLANVGRKSSANRFHTKLEKITAHRGSAALILGNSTTEQWLTPAFLAEVLGTPSEEVTDATLSGCYPSCSHNVVSQLLAQNRHYDRVFLGLNLYELCEAVSRRRLLEETSGRPLADFPELLGMHLRSMDPATSFGRFVGVTASDVYSDAFFVQRYYFQSIYGETKRHDAHAWYSPSGRSPAAKRKRFRAECGYGDAETAMTKAVLHSLLVDLSQLSNHTFLLLLPDKALASKASGAEQRWVTHRAVMRQLAQATPHVDLLDLSVGEHVAEHYFRDPIHLTKRGYQKQKAAFQRALRALAAP
jgi:hypothetical protein